MKKIIEIIRLKNLSALVLFLSAAAFVGCASEEPATSRSDSTPGKTSDVAVAKTPENKTESSRLEPLENHDSEEPEVYRPARETDSKMVTKANFDRIKIGMSYSETVKIFGEEGMQTSTMKVNNRETTIFKWTMPDFSKYIDLHFENDKVIEKKQKGLM
jgi:Domain of Unknown Function with PDB structure (DUF3862)